MAKKEKKESKIILERTYIIPLRREFIKVPKYRKAKKAIIGVKEFLMKHMKSDNVKVGKSINLKVWENGIKNPPAKVQVNVVKYDDGLVVAELVGAPVKVKEDKKKEAKSKKSTVKKETKKEEKTEESEEEVEKPSKKEKVDSEEKKKKPALKKVKEESEEVEKPSKKEKVDSEEKVKKPVAKKVKEESEEESESDKKPAKKASKEK
jgi:large subunit ribosomal protein L31e